MNLDDFRAHLMPIYQNNEDALNLSLMLIKVCDVWDDIVDGDKPCYDDVNKAFMICLFSLDENNFYMQHKTELRPVIRSVMLRWLDANELENNKEHLEKAYMLRAGLYDIFAHTALIIGGYDYYKTVGPLIRKLYGETFKDYEGEIKCQIQ